MVFKEFGNKGHFDDTFENDENSESESELVEGEMMILELFNIIILDGFLFISKIKMNVHWKMDQMINLMFILDTI